MIDLGANIATTPLAVGVEVVLARQPNVVPQSRDNVGLWDGAPLGLINVQTAARVSDAQNPRPIRSAAGRRPACRGTRLCEAKQLAGPGRYRRLKHACSRATCCGSQTRAPLSAVSRSEEYQDAAPLPRRL